MRKALAQPGDNIAYRRFSRAYQGKSEGLHAYFAEALRLAESSQIDVETGEALGWELQTIQVHLGDRRFARALEPEPLRVRSAVAACCPGLSSSYFPESMRILEDAPKINFPLLQAYRGTESSTE